jgi:type IV pilus assembly protein PilE
MILQSKQKGFTLIEMMIVVSVLGILTSIAYSSYMKSVMKSNRTDAKTELADLAQRMQRCYTGNGTYATAAGVCTIIDELSSADGVTTRGNFYVVKASNLTATTYTLTATPAADSVQSKDADCTSFVLNQRGNKSAEDKSSIDSTDKCW